MTTKAAGYITDVAYIPGFYPNMAPVAMRYAAALNRVVPPQTSSGFRYLELGCGLGRSFTTLAAANPHGEFIGVDVNPDHIRSIEHDLAAGRLTNARAIASDFAGLSGDLGTFDFIALHGVFSWVSDEVRRDVLAIARERLAPGGLLIVSYNSMPGWAHLQPIRGILRQYAQLRQGDSVQKMRDALAYLVFIRDRHARYFDDNPKAAAYVDGLVKQDIRYLTHEYLNEHWTSFYFSEVAGMFGGAGLSFVGSLPVFTNFWDLCVRPEFQELFRTTSDRLVTEAHKDFCANTAFRWDIYAKEPRVMANPTDRLGLVDDLYFHLAKPGVTLPYKANLGVITSTVQGPIYERLLGLLGGRSMKLSEIVAAPEMRDTEPVDMIRAVDAGVAMGLFEVTNSPLEPAPAAVEGAVSLTSPFNRAILVSDSLGGRPVALASEKSGTGHTLGDLDAAVLHELTERGRSGLAERVESRLVAAGRSIQQDGKPVANPETRRQLISDACSAFVTKGLPLLVRLGIVTA